LETHRNYPRGALFVIQLWYWGFLTACIFICMTSSVTRIIVGFVLSP
jgi:hypothetical protein